MIKNVHSSLPVSVTYAHQFQAVLPFPEQFRSCQTHPGHLTGTACWDGIREVWTCVTIYQWERHTPPTKYGQLWFCEEVQMSSCICCVPQIHKCPLFLQPLTLASLLNAETWFKCHLQLLHQSHVVSIECPVHNTRTRPCPVLHRGHLGKLPWAHGRHSRQTPVLSQTFK